MPHRSTCAHCIGHMQLHLHAIMLADRIAMKWEGHKPSITRATGPTEDANTFLGARVWATYCHEFDTLDGTWSRKHTPLAHYHCGYNRYLPSVEADNIGSTVIVHESEIMDCSTFIPDQHVVSLQGIQRWLAYAHRLVAWMSGQPFINSRRMHIACALHPQSTCRLHLPCACIWHKFAS